MSTAGEPPREATAKARDELVGEFGLHPATEIKTLKLIVVEHGGRIGYPGFQFDADDRPRPEMAPLISALTGRGLTGWDAALWFVAPAAQLDGQRPIDLMDGQHRKILVQAAGYADDDLPH